MAIKYYRLKQAATGSSPITGDTIYMRWDSNDVPAGLTQSTTTTVLNSYPNSTWEFRSRLWTLEDLGTTPISYDTDMLNGEKWIYNDINGSTAYVGFTFDIETTIFAQNYESVITETGTVFSPKRQTNFYSASSVNDTTKVVGTDTNLYRIILLDSQADYDHITTSGLTNYDFVSATPKVNSAIDNSSLYEVVPYSATSAVSYFNNLYDGWISETDDCAGNQKNSAYGVIYTGDMQSREVSYSSIYNGPCLKLDRVQIPFSGNTNSGNLQNYYNIIENFYTNCEDCEDNAPYPNTYFFSASTTCDGNTVPTKTFTGDTMLWANPLFSGGIATTIYLKVDGECFGGEESGIVHITPTTINSSITDSYNTCADCTGSTNPIQTYYYFSACTGGQVYRANIVDFQNELGSVIDDTTYLLENIRDLNDGCYTVISSSPTFINFYGFGASSSITAVSNCGDNLCQTIIQAERCDTPGIYYEISGYTGNSIVGEAFYLDYSDDSGCYEIVSGQTVSGYLSIVGQVTTDYRDCTECNNSNTTPTPTPTPTQTGTPAPTTAPVPDPCSCLVIDEALNIFATGNTDPSSNGVVVLTYTSCTTNKETTYNANYAGLHYICAKNAVLTRAEFLQDDIIYSASTYPWTPFPSFPSNTLSYGNNGACSGDPCGPSSPSPTPTTTSTPTPTTSPQATYTPTPTPTPTPSSTISGSLADKLESCETTTQNQKVFVFYDGTSLSDTTALEASESIRSWYQTKVTNGELLSDNLYEGVIGENNNNGENWLWWATYPYLGSLTGGTIVDEFSNPVSLSDYDVDYCKSNVAGECVPKSVEFNDKSQTNAAYRRINRGYELTGTYGIDDTRSNGVPFDHNYLDFSSTSGPGTFSGGEINYIVIIVADESDGVVGLYHGRQTKTELYTDPFRLSGTGWKTGSFYEYTDRFEYDYQAYLKVWKEIKSSGGTINGLIYPVIDNSSARIPFAQHSVAAIEGETISSIEFVSKYGESINSVGPESLNLSALTYTNVYSGLTGTTAYNDLDSQYKNGAGLKNFGFYVDPTVTNFTENVVSSTLNNFLLDIQVPNSIIYLNPGNRNRYEIYNIDGDCYTVTEVSIIPPEPITIPTTEVGPFSKCDECESTGCFSATTDGFYTFTDCCGVLQQGTTVGLNVCVDTSFTYQGLSISANSCIPDCDEGPLDYTFTVTGTCDNPLGGTIQINPLYGVKPYTITNTVPGTLSTQTGNGPFLWYNVSEGSYTFLLQDSSGGQNQSISINVVVDGCFTAELETSGTTCNEIESGGGTVTASSNSLPYEIDLYKNGVGIVESVTSYTQTYVFDDLTSGTYYAIVTDFGGATAQTNNDIVVSSSTVDFSLITVNDSRCTRGYGSATLSGVTGTAPFTYLWSDGQTGTTATGLTSGTWSVTVTDANGCFKTQEFNIGLSDVLGIVSTVNTQASCFECDGTMSVTISGGTPPYTYLGDTGQNSSTNNTAFTLTGLCAGAHSIIITDAGGCNKTATSVVTSTAGFTLVAVNVTNSTCNNSGSINIQITAPSGLFTYTITDSVGTSQSITTSNQSHTFSNLSSDTYTVTIESNGGDCSYTVEKVVSNVEKFSLITSVSASTCNQDNGQIYVELSAGTESLQYPFDYVVTNLDTTQVVYQNIDTGVDELLISGLTPGTYQIDVTDKQNCTVSEIFTISISSGINFGLTKTDCVLGDDGTATVTIYEGLPPFTILWSNGESSTTINGLTGGTYSVTITDSNNCSDTKSIVVNCDSSRVECYELNPICEDEFITTVGSKRGFEQMLNEAFIDLTSGNTNCILNQAIFYVNITLSGGSVSPPIVESQPFYTGYTLTDYPSDAQWVSAIESILAGISEVGSYTLDPNTNQLIIKSDCDGDEDPLRGAYFKLSTKIVLDIDCDTNPTPTPTPTPTSTPNTTPTQTITPTPTKTSTPTPTPTDTSVTISLTNTITACAKGSISVIKNGTSTLYSYSVGGSPSGDFESVTLNAAQGDTITIYANADVPTGAACAGIAFYTDINVSVTGLGTPISIQSIDSDSYSFTATSSINTITITMVAS